MIKSGRAPVNEARAPKEFTIVIHRRGRTSEVTGTLEYLIDYFGYTLERGASWQNEKGNKKINKNPKNIKSLVDNLNNAESNASANGAASTFYTYQESAAVNEATNPLASQVKKGDWVVVDLNPKVAGLVQLIPVKVSMVKDRMFRGWAWNEREHEYSCSQIRFIGDSEKSTDEFIMDNEKKSSKELKDSIMQESVSINESTYDGDTVNWNKIDAGDVVGWTIEGMGRPPKVGDFFRVGPFIGHCTKVSGSKVYMKVESNAYKDLNESVYYVSGSTPTGEGDANTDSSKKITDPAKAIEQWFKIGSKHRTGTAITAMTKKDAIALVTWADENQDKIKEWHEKYKCPYKIEYLLKAISDQVRRKCSSFYEGEFGDMIYPFDVG